MMEQITEKAYSVKKYTSILDDLGITYIPRYPWVVVGESKRIQGWKIHLSSVQLEAGRLLDRVLPYLIARELAFKIAEDYKVLSQLNEGALGDTQVGKFMTIYPESDELSRKVAVDLLNLTEDFHGPTIPSDLHLGSVVYTRYGAYNPIVERNRFGFVISKIYNIQGILENDRYQVPFDIKSFERHPFSEMPNLELHKEDFSRKGEERLFGPGYLVLEVVKSHSKGSVFRVMDLRSQENVGIKIIKQGRRHCFSDEHGRDVRTRLKHQYDLHKKLQDKIAIPAVHELFEVEEDSYLVMDNIEGDPFESVVAHSLGQSTWMELPVKQKEKIISYFTKMIQQVTLMHENGVIHRDLTPRNIFITPDDAVYLIDLELSYVAGSQGTLFDMGTIGYMSSNQENRGVPEFMDDIYSMGCIFLYGMTGLDPRKILFQGVNQLNKQLIPILGKEAMPMIKLIQRMLSGSVDFLHDDLIVDELYHYLGILKSSQFEYPKAQNPVQKELADENIDSWIDSAVRGLGLSCYLDPEFQVWHSDISHVGGSQHNRFSGKFGIRYDANAGIAGPVYLLSRLARFGYKIPSDVRTIFDQSITIMTSDQVMQEHTLPGLHFGSAGRGIALSEAILSGLCESTPGYQSYITKALSGPVDWPDITHGAAGQGLAALSAYNKIKNIRYLKIANECTGYLIETQNEDGSWTMPDGVDGISGETLTGFAHGVSGILYFLVVYQHETKADIQRFIDLGLDWLLAHSMEKNKGKTSEWKYSDKNEEVWKWWCHGAPGIALTFLKLYEITNNEEYGDVARNCLNVYPDAFLHSNLSQCHGLSGIGDIYLEAYRVFRDEVYLEKARNIARVLVCFRQETGNGEFIWLAENANRPTADLMTGACGIIHFLLRLRLKGLQIGFPLLPDPS